MSVFTNVASSSREEAAAYIAALLDLVGASDPLEILETTGAALGRTLKELSQGAIGQPEARGKWSIRQVLQHLADSELVWGYRLRMVLAQDRPQLVGYDQDLWAERLWYGEADAAQALHEFTVLRTANLRLLEGLPSEAWNRVGVHLERGEENIRHMVRLYAGHDLVHLRQIDRIRSAVRA